ncbi:MAG: cysteine desulfurase [Acidobacteria bacterium]|nr:cysteine desulfurase [Acidobacteriota bacterium]
MLRFSATVGRSWSAEPTVKRIYLDHNATTPQAPEVGQAMQPFFTSEFANPSSIHLDGQRVRHRLEEARAEVAAFLGGETDEIVFTGGGTESVNLAILGVARLRPGGHVVTTAIEHPAGLEACRQLEAEGHPVTYVPPGPDGAIDPDGVIAAIRPETVLVSVMHSNNETGVLQPVGPVGRECRRRGIPFHSDAVQSAGKTELRAKEVPADLLSIAAHKFYGPKGVGALYVRRGVRIRSLHPGGGQEDGRRAGTEPVALAVGMARACALARRLPFRYREWVGPLRDRLERGIRERLPGTRVSGANAPRLPNTASIRFPGMRAEEFLIRLDLEGFAASAGTACASGTPRPSHVLRAMGFGPAAVRQTVRFSLGVGNQPAEIDHLLDLLPALVGELRRGMPASAAAGSGSRRRWLG